LGSYPALDVGGADPDLVLAVVDDYSPTAVEESDGSLTVYFPDPALRNRAREAVAHAWPAAVVSARDVDDGDWARRSQEGLGPVIVGRMTVAPPWSRIPARLDRQDFSTGARARAQEDVCVVIQPSMGFGTGHHATTRLCLAALQTLDLADAFVLDVGTGSGVLALAARALGARRAFGIDNDPDAVGCAQENLALNPGVNDVVFARLDLEATPYPVLGGLTEMVAATVMDPDHPASAGRGSQAPDVITANLTGALLCRAASTLASTLAPGGSLVVSGLLSPERAGVVAAFQGLVLAWEEEEDGWLGLVFRAENREKTMTINRSARATV
jgi:ribosomal protein L11 methyltransferase